MGTITTEVPRFVHVLGILRTVYEIAFFEDFTDGRRVKRDFPGALPKRRGSAARLLTRLAKKHGGILSLAPLSAAERRLIVAAYDAGLFDRLAEQEKGGKQCR